MKYSFFIIEQAILDYTGIKVSLTVKDVNNGTALSIRPQSIQQGKGFSIDCIVGWRSIKASLNIEKLGKPVMTALSNSTLVQRCDCASYLKTLVKKSNIRLIINGSERNIQDPDSWPYEWEQIEIHQDSGPLTIEKMNESEIVARIIPHFAAVVSLLRNIEVEKIDKSYPEGAKTRIEVNRYERNPINRQLCIDHFGHLCQACEENMQDKYGDLAKDFIHVHHLTPVSQLENNYVIDPIVDLVPLCPNCHAIVHKTKPPLPIEELKQIVMEKREEYNNEKGK